MVGLSRTACGTKPAIKSPSFPSFFENKAIVSTRRLVQLLGATFTIFGSVWLLFQRCEVVQQQPLTQQKTKTFSQEPPLQICHQSSFGGKDQTGDIYPNVKYQCQGAAYDTFTRRMRSFADNTIVHGSTWGRRKYPLPDNTTVLILGNSHTRQMGLEMACQYSHVLRSVVLQHGEWGLIVFEFENNSTVHLLTNVVVVYSYDWQNLLEVVVGKKLIDFDVLVLGVFNLYAGQVTTNFDLGMIADSKDWPNVDYINIAPPTPWTILQRYPGRAVLLSMFSDWPTKWTELQEVAQYHAPRVKAIDARKYVPLLGECGAVVGNDTCFNDAAEVPAGWQWPMAMHRCVGANGGHPTLAAWDVIEFTHDEVTPPK
jgi:hypothetical protein